MVKKKKILIPNVLQKFTVQIFPLFTMLGKNLNHLQSHESTLTCSMQKMSSIKCLNFLRAYELFLLGPDTSPASCPSSTATDHSWRMEMH